MNELSTLLIRGGSWFCYIASFDRYRSESPKHCVAELQIKSALLYFHFLKRREKISFQINFLFDDISLERRLDMKLEVFL